MWGDRHEDVQTRTQASCAALILRAHLSDEPHRILKLVRIDADYCSAGMCQRVAAAVCQGCADLIRAFFNTLGSYAKWDEVPLVTRPGILI